MPQTRIIALEIATKGDKCPLRVMVEVDIGFTPSKFVQGETFDAKVVQIGSFHSPDNVHGLVQGEKATFAVETPYREQQNVLLVVTKSESAMA